MRPYIAICFLALLSVAITTTETQDPGVPASIVSVALPGCDDGECRPIWSPDCCSGPSCDYDP